MVDRDIMGGMCDGHNWVGKFRVKSWDSIGKLGITTGFLGVFFRLRSFFIVYFSPAFSETCSLLLLLRGLGFSMAC